MYLMKRKEAPETLAAICKYIRAELDINQQELADILECSRLTIIRLENDQHMARLELLSDILDIKNLLDENESE